MCTQSELLQRASYCTHNPNKKRKYKMFTWDTYEKRKNEKEKLKSTPSHSPRPDTIAKPIEGTLCHLPVGTKPVLDERNTATNHRSIKLY